MPNDCIDAQNHRQIAGPLGDLFPAKLAFLLQPRQRFVNHGQQLQNNRGGNVGHDAQGEDRQPAQVAAAEQIDEAEQSAAGVGKQACQGRRINAGCRQVAADAVDGKQPKREQYALAQVRNFEDVRQLLEHGKRASVPMLFGPRLSQRENRAQPACSLQAGSGDLTSYRA